MLSRKRASRYTPHIYKALAFINDNLPDPLTLNILGQEAYFSPYHFHRIFTEEIGETPKAFVNRLRIEKAANLLLNNPSLSMTEIAFMTGFSSSATFARSFNRHFGLSASELKACYTSWRASTDDVNHKIYTGLSFRIQIQQMPTFHVAYVASLKDGYRRAGEAWKLLEKWAALRGLLTSETIRLGVCYDYSIITPLARCRYYACLTVPDQTPADDVIGILDIPGGKYAVYHFEGHPSQLRPTYEALTAIWLPRSGYQRAYQPPYRTSYETLRIPPESHPKGLVTMDIYLPVMPR
jgi:AraC family transcriptional regulator